MSDIKDILKRIIVENQNRNDDNLIGRDLQIERIPKKATVVLGVRRCGKTSLLVEYLSSLVKDGLDRTCVCHIDFSDDRLLGINTSGGPGVVADAYYELYPENHEKKVYYLFDEIDRLDNWENLVNRLMNTEKCEVNITGSSSSLLLNETSTAMGGRKMGWELFCYSYGEFLRAKGINADNQYDRLFRDSQTRLFGEYLETGGFPEALLFSKPESRRIFHQNTANDIVYRDIVLRHSVSKPEALKILINVLFSSMGCMVTETKLYQRLAGMRVNISKPTMSEYIGYAVDSFAFFLVPIRSYNLSVRAVNGKKLYTCDHALAAAVSNLTQDNIGQKLENIVFLHIRRMTDLVFYYRTKSGYEVDFAYGSDSSITLVQVSAVLGSAETENREKRSLFEAMEELELQESTIVTLEEEKEITENGKTIHILPAWKYLLFS